MRTSELFEERLVDYVKRLISKENVKKLGAGAYAAVFQHPEFKNMVVKVFTSADKNYASYLKWTLAHQSNKWVPKIVDVVPIKSETGDEYTIVFMKKLTPATDEMIDQANKKLFQKLLARYGTRFDDERLLPAQRKNSRIDLTEPTSFAAAMPFVKEQDPDLYDFLKFLKAGNHGNADLHADNVMFDGDQLVFTDPIGASPDSAHQRLDTVRVNRRAIPR